MKKIIFIFVLMLSVANAFAAGEHQVATSQAYVTEELDTRQDKFNKLGADTAMTYSGATNGAIGSRTISGNLGTETNTSDSAIPTVGGVNTKLADQQDTLNLPADTVLMNTGTAGAPAAKGIYDDTGSYAAQQDALIDAATLNAAVQTAINSEFVCVERKIPGDDTSPCYLFEIASAVNPSRNLFDISKVQGPSRSGSLVNNGDGSITVTDEIGNSAICNPDIKLSDMAPELVAGGTYTLSLDSTGRSRTIYIWGSVKEYWKNGASKTITQDWLDAYVCFYANYNGVTPSTATISNIQIEEGTVATPYQPYGQNTFLPTGN